MDHFRTALVAHQEWRLFNCVMPDRDDQVRELDRIVHVVALGKGGGADIEVRAAVDGALAHLRVEERKAAFAARNLRAEQPAEDDFPPRRS